MGGESVPVTGTYVAVGTGSTGSSRTLRALCVRQGLAGCPADSSLDRSQCRLSRSDDAVSFDRSNLPGQLSLGSGSRTRSFDRRAATTVIQGSSISQCSTVSGMAASNQPVVGEKRWPMAITLVVAMTLPFLLPPKFSAGPVWIVPVMEALLLVALVIADPGRIDRRSSFVRTLSIGLVVILVAGATAATARLVVDLVRGGPETNSPGQLLRVGSLTWVYLIITFSFLYWELDGGGPETALVQRRSSRTSPFPNISTLT